MSFDTQWVSGFYEDLLFVYEGEVDAVSMSDSAGVNYMYLGGLMQLSCTFSHQVTYDYSYTFIVSLARHDYSSKVDKTNSRSAGRP